jgi:hypothetical protein
MATAAVYIETSDISTLYVFITVSSPLSLPLVLSILLHLFPGSLLQLILPPVLYFANHLVFLHILLFCIVTHR